MRPRGGFRRAWPGSSSKNHDVMLYLLFQVGGDRYAIEARQAVEVVPLLSLKRVPMAARGVAGILNYRGRPVAAVDLSELIGGRPARERLSTRIIIVQHVLEGHDNELLGLIVENATELMQREGREFVSSGLREETGFCGPMLMDEQGVIQLIRPQKLLPGALTESLLHKSQG